MSKNTMFLFVQDSNVVSHPNNCVVGTFVVTNSSNGFDGHGVPCVFDKLTILFNDGTTRYGYRNNDPKHDYAVVLYSPRQIRAQAKKRQQ